MKASVLTLLALWGCDGASESPENTPPNILLITLDTTRADHLSCYGHPAGATPVLDGLAAQGARFSRAYTVTPLTIPAHSSLFTGMYPPRHGVRDNGDFFLSEDAVTLAERLNDAGYQTMASVGAEVTSHHWGFAQGFDAFFDDMSDSADERNRWRVERSGDKVVDDALGWLETEVDSEQPWFSWVHMFDVHHPYTPPEPYASRYPDPYVGELAFVDSQVGRLLDHLRTKADLDNTWVLVMSDHGEGRGSHGEGLHGVLLYDATTRIPLIIRGPDKPAVGVVEAPSSLVDVFATVLDIAALEPAENIDGRSLLPLTAGTEATEGEGRSVYLESMYGYYHYSWAPQSALVDPNHKLIHSTTPELYSRFDRNESNNLATVEPDQLAQIIASLDARTAVMEPAENTADRAQLSAERAAQLEALGYMVSGPSEDDDGSIPDNLPDPVSQLPLLGEIERVRLAMQEGDFDTAQTAAEAVLEKSPGFFEVRWMLSLIMKGKGDLDAAEEVLVRMIEDKPQSSMPLVGMGGVQFQRGNLSQAEQFLAQAIEIDPYLSNAWGPYLHTLFIQRKLELLKKRVPEARERLPTSPEVMGMEGILMAIDNAPEAEEVLRASLAAAPRQPFIRTVLATLLRQAGEDQEAESLLLDEIHNSPPSVPARKNLVEMYAEQQRFTEQIEQLNVIITVQPPNHLDFHSRAQAHFNTMAYERALEDIIRCQRTAPQYAPCLMLEANALKKMGREAEAEAAYLRALEMAKSQP